MENWIYLMVVGATAAGYILYKKWNMQLVRESDGNWTWVLRRRMPQAGKKKKDGGMLPAPVIPDGATPRSETISKETASVKFRPYRIKPEENGHLYRERFLINDGMPSRVSTYINRDTHEKIKRLLSNAAPGVSIVSYINNILVHHLEQYEQEITQLYRSGIDKPF